MTLGFIPGKLPGEVSIPESAYEVAVKRRPSTACGTPNEKFREACPEFAPSWMQPPRTPHVPNRSVLQWHHIPEEEWKSETHAQYVNQGRPESAKRHNDHYYRQMSGRGTPSSRESKHGYSGKTQLGLGNVLSYMQVPHQSCFSEI